MAQLLRSNSVAVSTSHDFEDKATITAFCNEKTKAIIFSVCELATLRSRMKSSQTNQNLLVYHLLNPN